MKRPALIAILAPLTFITHAYAADGCRPGYSMAFLKNVRNNAIEASYSEVRGSGLFYVLKIEISTESAPRKRSAQNTILISGTAPASTQSGASLTRLSQFINGGHATALCVRVDQNSYYHTMVLPQQFNLTIGQLPGAYEIDLAQPIPRL